ncbi:MAG: hypothetical protein VXW32_12885 [Myxococcota bacterium]|nr:hypothetical protein [Myxococcota bacterium]
MHRYLISALFFGAACGNSSLKVDVSEEEIPSDDTASPDAEDDDDEDDEDDDDEDEDEDEDETEFSGSFTFGPMNIPPFCEGEMEGTLESTGVWYSEGDCTISAGPGTGVELDFYVEGQLSGTDLSGTTYVVEGNNKFSLDTEGTYSKQREVVALEWTGELTNPQGEAIEVIGEALLYVD